MEKKKKHPIGLCESSMKGEYSGKWGELYMLEKIAKEGNKRAQQAIDKINDVFEYI